MVESLIWEDSRRVKQCKTPYTHFNLGPASADQSMQGAALYTSAHHQICLHNIAIQARTRMNTCNLVSQGKAYCCKHPLV
eukprot:scaffold40051_cov23-Prasinocladus_malaysianus.AAC.1